MEVSDDMQRQAKALADPSRFRLFRHIAEADREVGVAELTELLGFNHNAIRQHLAVLTGAGLVAETTERRTTRGRPRKEYRARADALGAFRSVSGSYERLASLLLEVVATGNKPYDVGFDAGRAEAEADDETDSSLDDAVDRLVRQLGVGGFEPDRTSAGTDLMHCPFADVAAENPGVVCSLHHGLISGFLAGRDETLIGELDPHDPYEAGCRVTVGRRNERPA